jgi:RHS repeat-associated protein
MARPTGWDILGLDGDPTPGVVESVQALAKEFGDFAHDVEAAYHNLNSFGSDAAAMKWIGQTADAFKNQYGPLPGRLQKLYTSYSEASDALSAYAPLLQAAQTKADTALRQAQDAHADLQRATSTANNAATDLKTAQQNQAANPDQKAVTDAQTAHDTAQTNLNNAKAQMAALTKLANDAYNDRIEAAKTCGSALGHAQSDGIHNKSWWDHVGEDLSKWGGEIGKIAGELAPILDIIALATSWIPGVDVVTAALAEIDNIVAIAGTAMATIGDAMQGHWGDALLGAGMLALTFVGGRALGSGAEDLEGEAGALEGEAGALDGEGGALGDDALEGDGVSNSDTGGDPVDLVSGRMVALETDLELPGVLPIVLRRAYASGYRTGRLFGPGWSSTLDERLSVNAAGIHLAGDDGQTLHYPVPSGDEEVLPVRGARWPLVWDRAADEIRVTDPRGGLTRHFPHVHFEGENGQIRDLARVTDRNGNRIDIVRDAQGTPTGVEHDGYRLAVDSAATANGPRVAAIRVLDGSEHGVVVKRYEYDDRGRLTGVVNSSGRPYTYRWDDADRITAWANRAGFRYSYEYDDRGRVVRGTGADGYLSGEFSYDPAARTTVFRDSLGRAKTYHYDVHGHVDRVIDADGAALVFHDDLYGRRLRGTDRRGMTTVFDRDAAGNTIRVQRPDGTTLSAEFNALNALTLLVQADGTRWRQEHDAAGNVVVQIDPLEARTEFGYDTRGSLVSITDDAGDRTVYEADAAGQTVSVTGPDGAVHRIARDAFGRAVAVTGPDGGLTRYEWSVEGGLRSRVGPDGAREEWQTDADGELVAYTDQRGAVTRYEVGPFGTVAARIEADAARFEYRYDTEMQLVAVTGPGQVQWAYTYDHSGNLVRETDYNGRSLLYTYDADGWLTESVDALGHRTVFSRDPLGRVVGRQTVDAEFAYGYDPNGRMLFASGAGSRLDYAYDARGRVVAETVDGRTTRSGYDAMGRRVARVTPAGAESSWRYDAKSRPVVFAAGDVEQHIRYDISGRETSRLLGAGGAVLSRDFDAAGRVAVEQISMLASPGSPASQASPASQSSPGSGHTSLSRSYAYHADGIPAAMTDSLRGRQEYVADPRGRISEVRSSQGGGESYSYDGFGTVVLAAHDTQADSAGGRAVSGTRVLRAGRVHYDYDAAGRVVRIRRQTLSGQVRIQTFAWDADGRLKQAGLPDGSAWHYRYDPLGRRLAKQHVLADGSEAERVEFAWDGPRLVEQTSVDAGGRATAVTWDYDPDSGLPAAQRRRSWAADAPQEQVDEVFHTIVTDLAGMPTELVTPDGRVAWYQTTDLFGRSTFIATDTGTETECPLRFAGQYFDDETGLHYNVQRYYDPSIAAYLSPDPLGLAPALNDHAYVANPLTMVDPLGLASGPRVPSPPFSAGGYSTPGNNQELNVDDMLKAGEDWLGPGYTEPKAGSGRFVSSDGSRVFRMGDSDILGQHGGGPHCNFEYLEPDPRTGRMAVTQNDHVYFTNGCIQ